MRFWKDESGAALIYVTVIVFALVGLSALALDAGRLFTLRQQVQKAADAAALAGAWQLDGTQAGSTRATAAAGAVVANAQQFGATAGNVSIASTDFWASVPASDDAPLTAAATAGANNYNFIQVTTTAVTMNNLLMQAFGGGASQNITARAVARKGEAICQVTPLFVCLPGGASFNPANYIGSHVLMRAGGGGGSWTGGNWGLLDTPGGSQSTNALASMIAGSNGLPQCIGTSVDTKPGNVASVATAFNVRLDMYENPQSSGFRTQPGYAPAENVGKGRAPNANCNNWNTTARDTKMPVDPAVTNANRFGAARAPWNCTTYWSTAHPTGFPGAGAAPTGCTTTSTLTRWEVYRHEILGAANKANVPNTTGASPAGDNGNPTCYTGGPIPPTPTAQSQLVNDRRIFSIAGVDCSTLGNGNQSNVPVLMYLSMFIIQPTVTTGGNQGDVYMEIVGHSENGGGGLVPVQLREWVELVR